LTYFLAALLGIVQGLTEFIPISSTAHLVFASRWIDLYSGNAEPGTTIHAVGREAIVPTDGNFQLQVTIAGSIREIVVEAQDPKGNSSQYKVSLGRNRKS